MELIPLESLRYGVLCETKLVEGNRFIREIAAKKSFPYSAFLTKSLDANSCIMDAVTGEEYLPDGLGKYKVDDTSVFALEDYVSRDFDGEFVSRIELELWILKKNIIAMIESGEITDNQYLSTINDFITSKKLTNYLKASARERYNEHLDMMIEEFYSYMMSKRTKGIKTNIEDLANFSEKVFELYKEIDKKLAKGKRKSKKRTKLPLQEK